MPMLQPRIPHQEAEGTRDTRRGKEEARRENPRRDQCEPPEADANPNRLQGVKIMTDIKTLTDEQLARHVKQLYNEWMYHEAAERGYDHQAASEAARRHSEALAELELRKCREQAKPLTALTEMLVCTSES
jgi:hypothetical protein